MVFNSIGPTPEKLRKSILGQELQPSLTGCSDTLVPGMVTGIDPRLFLKVQRNSGGYRKIVMESAGLRSAFWWGGLTILSPHRDPVGASLLAKV
jgi:hypothetical protein